jgi:hypothetical protein
MDFESIVKSAIIFEKVGRSWGFLLSFNPHRGD